ncbi:YciI family protein [Pseudarthrobacter sp. P1]|uniref:YciI family protein n=1 Tax=Pseudarthrobacter sp. P1 TaxID=3418418 RepID=UPI003CF2575B
MLYAIHCLDTPDSGQARASVLEAHRDYVDGLQARIVMSGPLLAEDGVERTGQLYVVEAADEREARRFIDEDPFTTAGVFASITVHRFWAKFLNGSREAA